MLRIPTRLRDLALEHARQNWPQEACGVFVAPAGSRTVTRWQPFLNIASNAHHRFELDPAEQIAFWRQMDQQNEDPLVIFHSHTSGHGPTPSPEDRRIIALHDRSYHLIVSLPTADGPAHWACYRYSGRAGVVATPYVVDAD